MENPNASPPSETNIMAFEQTKDFRSATQSSKRFKEHKAKWSSGSRPSPGVRHELRDPNILTSGSESQRAKIRPVGQRFKNYHIQSHNVVKPRNARIAHDLPQSHSRAKCEAITELKDPSNTARSIYDMLSSPVERRASVSDNFLYSFDRNDTPGKPLSLEVFLKTNPRETEKLVEKEYEILDGNGEPLKGRKARRDLRRQSPHAIAKEPGTNEVEGFELV